ncbi:hypothetical protein GCM10020369_78410 [Cryptosporangium minutisporangium]|uniref:Uncharacterized protein n=1 Tax=Cryptosporangium minutisporangium TaxID=113569 RepID=A0ABP6TAL5_9ACTN
MTCGAETPRKPFFSSSSSLGDSGPRSGAGTSEAGIGRPVDVEPPLVAVTPFEADVPFDADVPVRPA